MCYSYEDDQLTQQKRQNDLNGFCLNSYNRYHLLGRVLRYTCNKIGKSELVKQLFPRKPIGYIAGGWDWFSWSSNVVNFVFEQLSTPVEEGGFKEMLERFNHTHAPCEKFFQTMLFNHLEELHIRKHYPLRFVSWLPHRPLSTSYLPYTLNELDYEYIINSPTFFCRKVDENKSAKLLDMIDSQRGNPFDIDKYTNFM